jgi:hypothetical protein
MKRPHLSYANVVSTVCLFVVLGGTSYAAATGSIGSRELRNNSVRSKDIRNGDVSSRDVRDRSLLARDFRGGQLPKGDPGATGPRGVTGPSGPAGRNGINAASKIFTRYAPPSSTGISPVGSFAGCLAGEKVMGGGWERLDERDHESAVHADRPAKVVHEPGVFTDYLAPANGTQEATGWFARVESAGTDNTKVIQFRAYAQCAAP